MGAYLYYKLANKNKAEDYNKFIANTELGKRLIKAESLISVYDSEDVEFTKINYPNLASFYQENIGKGEFKASGISTKMLENADCETLEEFYELVTRLFVLAQKKYKMYFASRSCAFNTSGCYFSINQMKRITNNGKRLKTSTSDPEKYQELMNLLGDKND